MSSRVIGASFFLGRWLRGRPGRGLSGGGSLGPADAPAVGFRAARGKGVACPLGTGKGTFLA
jgi:hypothetical protein